MTGIRIPIVLLEGAECPKYQTIGSAGIDLHARLDAPVVIPTHGHTQIPTGLAIALPQGFELQIRARSGLAAKYGIMLTNGIGTIDSDYRGELCVLLYNSGAEPFTVNSGDRIAQAVLARYERIEWHLVDSLDETERGTGGFGSTGVRGAAQ